MSQSNSLPKLAQPFSPVKSTINTMLMPSSDSMIHHNGYRTPVRVVLRDRSYYRGKDYGVSSSQRVLSPQLLLKKYDLIRECLAGSIELSVSQREVVLRLLRFWAYYGEVYTKEKTITELPGCSKATYWRTIKLLESHGLIRVVNRFLLRPHAQISNLYLLHRLIIVIARYLAEHGQVFREKWLVPALTMPGRLFWSQVYQTPGDRAGPGVLAF